jgi:hypothetical protein
VLDESKCDDDGRRNEQRLFGAKEELGARAVVGVGASIAA